MCQAKCLKLIITSFVKVLTLRLEIRCVLKKPAQTFTDAQCARLRDTFFYAPLKPDVSQSMALRKTHLYELASFFHRF
jgi:hypothetical protein